MIGVYIHTGYVVACVCVVVIVALCVHVCSGCVSTCGSQRWVSFVRSHSSCFPRQPLIGLECAGWEKVRVAGQWSPGTRSPSTGITSKYHMPNCLHGFWGLNASPHTSKADTISRTTVPVRRLLDSSGIWLYKVLMCDVPLNSIYW